MGHAMMFIKVWGLIFIVRGTIRANYIICMPSAKWKYGVLAGDEVSLPSSHLWVCSFNLWLMRDPPSPPHPQGIEVSMLGQCCLPGSGVGRGAPPSYLVNMLWCGQPKAEMISSLPCLKMLQSKLLAGLQPSPHLLPGPHWRVTWQKVGLPHQLSS